MAKWVALLAMTVDHYGKIFDPHNYAETHAFGRLTLPLIAWIIATRLALNPELTGRYLKRLVPWALVSQPVYVLAGRDWWEGNILITLVLGVAAHAAVRTIVDETKPAGCLVLAAILAVSLFTEYGPLGVALLPVIAVVAGRDPIAGAWLSGPLGVVANIIPRAPFLTLGDMFAVFATPFALTSTRMPFALPRLPTQLFYGYYPAHLLALHYIEVYG